MTLQIAIAGAGGRMGRALIAAASADARFAIVGGTERRESPALGADIGQLGGLPFSGVVTHDSASAAAAKATVWLDFTTPEATLAALESLTATSVRAAIVGTTGFDAAGETEIAVHAKRIAIVRSGNFSLGVTLLAALVEQAAQRLGAGWDIEISDAHHRRKVDAPSGTALLLGKAAAKGRGVSLSAAKLAPHDGATGPRTEGGIGFSVVRGGGLVGAHDVRFIAEREMLTLSHQAFNRAVFADGALAAALWAVDKPAGLYSMRDVLGI
jgi:4-hydroxy-tetrahydrodipicolinate reductase